MAPRPSTYMWLSGALQCPMKSPEGMSSYEAGALPAGAPAPLAKPFSARELADAVGALFGRRL